ncbi:peptidase S8/S53 domain-containing protein [Catenaria anguillulae PL171]|uniref:Peptidase S8/S53 domain-containing protein n=1 Tax=Catenaria anguillulae PL171 TaxID=765915 RepID=A0A1Y2HC71_9FUNG|nr:peptidase S8/S53 domain-containing protein [Catenaria anguillulae PL171]
MIPRAPLSLFTLLAVSALLLLSHPKDVDLFYSLLANATHNDPTFSTRLLHKRQLQQSGDPRACTPTFNIRSTSPEHRTQRRFHFIAFETLPEKCKFPNVQSQLPQLLAALDGKVVNSLDLIHAHVISFPASLPACELYHLPCVRYIEEDALSYVYQAQPSPTVPRQGAQPSASPAAPQQSPVGGGGNRTQPAAGPAPTQQTSVPAFPKPEFVDPQKVAKYTAQHREIKTPSNAPSGFQLWGLDLIDGVKNDRFSFEYTGKSAHVYVLDSGVESSHPDFKTKPKTDFVAQSVTASGDIAKGADCSGHGTHVSGIISGAVTGVAPEAQVHMLRVIGCPKTRPDGTELPGEAANADILQALSDLAGKIQRPAVLSMSLGPALKEDGEFPKSQALNDMLNEYTQRLQVPVVVAAGNNKSNKCSPMADVQDIIVVGALARYFGATYDENSRITRAVDYSNFGQCVHVYAPGSDIWSTSNKPTNVYESKRGTSQAAPFVSGIVAHLFDKYGGKQLSPGQVKDLLMTSFSVDRVEEIEGVVDKQNLKKAAHLPLERDTITAAFTFDTAHAASEKNKLLGMIAVIGGITGAVLLTCGVACWFRCRARRKSGPKVIGGGPALGTLNLRNFGEKAAFPASSPTAGQHLDPAVRQAAHNELFSKSPSTSARTVPGLAPGQGQPGFGGAPPMSPTDRGHPRPMSPNDSLYYPPQRSLNGSQVGVRGPGSPVDPRYSPQQHGYGPPPHAQQGYGAPPPPPATHDRDGYGGGRPDDRGYASGRSDDRGYYGGGGNNGGYNEPPRGGYQPRGYDWNRGEFDGRTGTPADERNLSAPPQQHPQSYQSRGPPPPRGPLSSDQVEYGQRPQRPRPGPGQGHPGGQRPAYQGRY